MLQLILCKEIDSVGKNLVIVESPAKAKTIKKYLGKDFEVLASYGHVRDLIPRDGAVDPEHDFAMRYQLIEKNTKHVEAISKAMQQAEALYLATDPDREGEAISWHLYEILKEKQSLQDKEVHRVVFHEITQRAIQEAVANPRQLSMDLINAQQARRVLDYLVGFNLSPLLWKKIRYGLSAGRVQSPALRLIVEREQEIERFKTEEYWTLEAHCQKEERQKLTARLNLFAYKKIKLLASEIKPKEQETHLSISNEEQATTMRATLLELAQGRLQVTKVEEKQLKRQPSSPFITSTLQQEAARKLGFATKKTMQIAQQLYEGIDIGQGAVGLITYMRTDSVHLADEAVADIRETIKNRYGEDNLPKQPRQFKTTAKNAQEAHEAIRPTLASRYPARQFKTTAKNAQEAHEAIRPTLASRYPEEITAHLSSDQLKLYTLIWQRTIACQMIHATLATVGVDLACGEGNNFRATGSTVLNQGFMRVYQEGIDDKKTLPEDERLLPPLTEGEWILLKDIVPEQHFTEPPPRFSEATLVKDLEKLGIGRPSTYATIISTLQQREYVTLDKKRFTPTDVGRIVNKFLTEHFTQYVDYGFTAKLEDKLDAVSRGEQAWIPLMGEFWTTFKHLVDEKAQTVQRSDVTQEATTEICPECGQTLNIRLGKRGRFIGCSAYPKCSYTRNVEGDATGGAPSTSTPTIVEDRTCPLCNSPLHIKQGPYSKFIGCSNYPKCKFTESLEKAVDTGIVCPQCHQGKLTRKKSRYGNFFYACTSYPTCKYAIAEQPLAETCPQCGWPILMLKTTKRLGTQKVCPQKTCDYHQAVPTPEPMEEKVENRD